MGPPKIKLQLCPQGIVIFLQLVIGLIIQKEYCFQMRTELFTFVLYTRLPLIQSSKNRRGFILLCLGGSNWRAVGCKWIAETIYTWLPTQQRGLSPCQLCMNWVEMDLSSAWSGPISGGSADRSPAEQSGVHPIWFSFLQPRAEGKKIAWFPHQHSQVMYLHSKM